MIVLKLSLFTAYSRRFIYAFCQETRMSIRNLTKVPKLSLVYFSVDQSTCVLETKNLRRKDTGKSYAESAPEKMATVTIRSGSKQLEALVIASDGKHFF